MNSFEHIHFAEVILIVSGIIYTLHGLIHQLIVGAAVGFFQYPEERQSRLILMMWITTGAFMSFLGFLPAISNFIFWTTTTSHCNFNSGNDRGWIFITSYISFWI
nr:Uncharacterized protein A9P81_3563 [Leptospira interrogans serovar Copenhageni/Icterohaemorrhagiae]